MPDLETSIREWRRQMHHAGVKDVDVLDELESHLREDIDRRTREGVPPEEAVRLAAAQIGFPSQLKSEFSKITGPLELLLQKIKPRTAGMNTEISPIEARWKTYTKALTFAAPALAVWITLTVFVFPKVQMLIQESHYQPIAAGRIFGVSGALRDHWTPILLAAFAVLFSLEWKSAFWPRIRRTSCGVLVFLVNAAVLLGVAWILIETVVAVPELMKR